MGEKRYSYHATISMKDKFDGSTVVCNIHSQADSKEKIYEDIEFQVKDVWLRISKSFPTELTKKDLMEKVAYLKQEKRWGNKRIINWFAKFGIDIDLPKQGRLRKGQIPLIRE